MPSAVMQTIRYKKPLNEVTTGLYGTTATVASLSTIYDLVICQIKARDGTRRRKMNQYCLFMVLFLALGI